MPATLRLFRHPKPVIGMIHVGALPGTPAAARPLRELIRDAQREAEIFRRAGVDGVMLENMHDTPYLRGGVGPEIVAAMTRLASAVKDRFQGPCGVQILAAANREALAANALAADRTWPFPMAHS